MLQRIEMAMHIWTRKPINPPLRTARSIYVIFVNSMPCYNSDRDERTLHSVLQPRGDICESGVTSTCLRTRLNERCRQNYRHGHLRDSCFSNVRHQSVHTSRHRIGEASAAVYRLQRCRDTGQLFLLSTCLVEMTVPCSAFKGKFHLDSWRRTPCSTLRTGNLESNGTFNKRH